LKKALLVLVGLFMVGCVLQAQDVLPPYDDFSPTPSGSFTLTMGAEPVEVLPNNTEGTWESCIGGLLFDGLTNGDNQMKPIPGLAESYEYDEETLTWTFNLRKGVKFHDGTEMTADDVVFSYKCVMHPDYPSVRFSNYASVVGAEEYRNGEITDFSQVAITAVNPYTVEIQLKEVDATFISYGATGVIPKNVYEPVYEEKGYGVQRGITRDLGYCYGTGPYKFEEWKVGQYIKLVANEDYWNPRGNPVAKDGNPVTGGIKDLYWVFIEDADARYAALKAGDLDIIATTVDQHFELVDDSDYLALRSPYLVYDYLCLNLDPEKTPLFQEISVRQAIGYAIDRETMAEQVLRGLGTLCNGPTHPLRWDYTAEVDALHPSYDPERSMQLMEAGGWTIEKDSGGNIWPGAVWHKEDPVYGLLEMRFEIATNYGNVRRADILQVLQQQLAAAGFEVSLRVLEVNAFYDNYLQADREFDTAVAGWRMGSDPQSKSLWNCDQVGGFNWTAYCNPQVDEWQAQASQVVTIEERKPLYEQIAIQLVRDLPYIWLNYIDSTVGTKPGLDYFYPCHPQGWYINAWQWEYSPQ